MEILIVGGGYIGLYTARRLERLLGEIGQQPVVEQLARYRLQADVRLVEQRQVGAGREPDDNPDGGAHPARQLLDPAPRRQVEVGEQLLGQFGAPVRVEPGGHPDRIGPRGSLDRIAPRARRPRGAAPRHSPPGASPNTRMAPVVGNSCPVTMRIRVVLPAPLRPSSPVTVPGSTVSETSSSAAWSR